MVHTLTIVNAVRKYPNLWNKSDSDYKNVQLRKDAWSEVCRAVFRDFDTNTDLMSKRMTMIQRKWRSSRDYFVKRLKSKGKPKLYSSSKYLRALSFLSPTITSTYEKIEADEEADYEHNAENDDDSKYFENIEENFEEADLSTEDTQELVTQVRIEDPVMINASNYSDQGHGKSLNSLDDFDVNRSFAMTMIKEMNGMSEQQNFQFRMEVMKALNTVKYKLPEYSKMNED